MPGGRQVPRYIHPKRDPGVGQVAAARPGRVALTVQAEVVVLSLTLTRAGGGWGINGLNN